MSNDRSASWPLAAWLIVLSPLTLPGATATAAEAGHDPFAYQREVIRRGVQAVLMCNGLFTSDRSIEQVFAQELAYLEEPLGTADGGPWRVDTQRRLVEVGLTAGPDSGPVSGADPGADAGVDADSGSGPEAGAGPDPDGPVLRAVWRRGIGCVVLAPDQSLDGIDDLPRLPAVTPAPAGLPWPQGDRVEPAVPAGIDAAALQAASDWAFDRDTPEQDTLSLLVVHRGQLIHERYAPGVDLHTRTRTWSTAKSIAATLIGMLVDAGRMSLDGPLDIDWLPEQATADDADPRRAITLRHLLNMSSGLYPVDSWGQEYANGSGLSYWAGTSSARGARDRGLIRTPGTYWDYENHDTLAAVHAMRRELGDDYHHFPRAALFDRIGMHTTLVSTDRFGDFVLSSQMYTNARDLARFGMLWEQNGVWNGERLLSEAWIDFVRTPAPAARGRGSDYGGQFWLVPEGRDDVPKDAYATAGNRGQYVIIVPSRDLVIVRRGLDHGRQGFDRWDLTREVLKALP